MASIFAIDWIIEFLILINFKNNIEVIDEHRYANSLAIAGFINDEGMTIDDKPNQIVIRLAIVKRF